MTKGQMMTTMMERPTTAQDATVAYGDLSTLMVEASRFVPKRPSMPMLACVLVESDGATLRVSAFDFENSYTRAVPATGGTFRHLIGAGLLLDVVKAVKGAATVTLAPNGDGSATLTADGDAFTLPKVADADDYPQLPAVSGPGWILPDGAWSELARVTVAAGKDDTLPTLTGVLYTFGADTVEAAATDRYRLAWNTHRALGDGDARALIPATAVDLVSRTFPGAVTVHVADRWVSFTDETGRTVTTRTLDGEFPKYRALIPSDPWPVVEADVKAWQAAIKRAAVVCERNAPVRVATEGGNAVILAGGGDDASATVVVKGATVDPRHGIIGFNPKYLMDGVTAVGGTVGMATVASSKPAVFGNGGSFHYLLMPVRLAG